MGMEKASLPVWRIRKGMDRRFQMGHPWVYSNELQQSPKGISPGELVELRDAAGKFLARGIGNPHSLIAFRALSRDEDIVHPLSSEVILARLREAAKFRERLGFRPYSHRLCFGEADGLPGLIIDRYLLSNHLGNHLSQGLASQVFVVQAHTAGMDLILPRLPEILEELAREQWKNTGVILRNDLAVRKLEGLTENPSEILKSISDIDLSHAMISIRPAYPLSETALPFEVDLVAGQKTGFFLDQFANIQLAAVRFEKMFLSEPQKTPKKTIRILDLFTYAGQWGAQLSRLFIEKKFNVEVVAVDASAKALEFAKKNIQRQGAKCETVKADIFDEIDRLPDQSFDLVISDPPALIKSRKDMPQGKQAYAKLATQVLRVLRPGGGVVFCSCSGLLDEESFSESLLKGVRRSTGDLRWIGRGGHSPDHPVRMEFPEGQYLKCWVGMSVG